MKQQHKQVPKKYRYFNTIFNENILLNHFLKWSISFGVSYGSKNKYFFSSTNSVKFPIFVDSKGWSLWFTIIEIHFIICIKENKCWIFRNTYTISYLFLIISVNIIIIIRINSSNVNCSVIPFNHIFPYWNDSMAAFTPRSPKKYKPWFL